MAALCLDNVADGDVLTYPLAILSGTCACSVTEVCADPDGSGVQVAFPTAAGRFVCLKRLVPGDNVVVLHAGSAEEILTLVLVYAPKPTHFPFVKLVYLLCRDSDGCFQAPAGEDNGLESALSRIRTMGEMIQAGTAEMMRGAELGRRTFALADDVLVRKLPITVAEAHRMSGMTLWSAIALELEGLPRRSDSIDVCIMSFTRMVNGEVRAHTALGGGKLALFGGGSIFTWPSSVRDIAACFKDERTFDSSALFDDSGHRASTLGRRACTSTTIGAVLHETGHCLSLPHPCGAAAAKGGGIMARGFENFSQLFLATEAREMPFWDRGSAVRLRHHRFLQFAEEPFHKSIRELPVSSSKVLIMPSPSPRPLKKCSPPTFCLRDGHAIIASDSGLGHVGFYKNGDNAAHVEFSKSLRSYVIPSVEELRQRCQASQSDKLSVSAIDMEGRISEIALEDIN